MHAARARRARVTLATRLLVGVGALVAAWISIGSVGAILELRRQGDFIGANADSGLSQAALCASLGRIQFIFVAGGLAAFASTSRSLRRIAPRISWMTGQAALGATVLALVIGLVATLTRTFVAHGETHFVVRDDAMISLRYAKNIALGFGPVYNPGEHVEGYTGPLWVALLALVHLARPSAAIAPLGALVLSWTSVVATLWALQGMMRRYGASNAWIAVTLAAVVVDADTVIWAFTGLETCALGAVVTASAWALATGRARIFGLLLALIPLVRSDALVIAVSLAALSVLLAEDRRRALTVVAFAAVPAVLHLVFRVAYYHAPLPNTYYLKVLAPVDRLITGVGGLGFRVVFLHGASILLALGTLCSSKAPAWLRGLVAVAVVQIIYGIYIGGDAFSFLRFVAPVLPIVAAGAACLLRSLLKKAPRKVVVPALAFFAFQLPVYAPTGVLGVPEWEPTFLLDSLTTAELLRENVPAGALITASYAGTIPYYDMGHAFLDTMGKNDAHIARSAKYFGRAIGHNKFDFDYVYDGRKPAVVHVERNCKDVDRVAGFSREELAAAVSGLPAWISPVSFYERSHATFAKRYLPNRVHLVGMPETSLFGCLFVRDDSGLPMFWSRTGAPERLRAARVEFTGTEGDGRVAFDGTWSAVEQLSDGRVVRRISAKGASSVDLWMEVTAELSLEVCSAGARPTGIFVNGASVSLSYLGECGRAVVSRDVLHNRQASTRVTLNGPTVAVERVSMQP